MPTAPTPNMSLILPTLGDDEGTWDDLLNAALGVGGVDDHDHSPGRGVKIKPTGIDINADLTFAGHRALNMAAAQLSAVDPATMAGLNRSFFVSNADNDLYYRNNAGVNVRVTTGATLNFSIVGGIGGDYTAVGALFSFDDATDRYLAQQQGAPRPWAGVAVGNLDIYQQAASIVNRVRLKSPAALAASYDLTLLTALPGSTQILQVSAAGQISASNTIANAVALVGSLDAQANVTVGGTFSTSTGQLAEIKGTLHVVSAADFDAAVNFDALVTLQAGALVANNQNIQLQGTGYIQHGNRTATTPMTYPNVLVESGSVNNNGTTLGMAQAISSVAKYPLHAFEAGKRIKSVVVRVVNTPAANITYELYVGSSSGVGSMTWTQIGSAVLSTLWDVTVPTTGLYAGTGYPIAQGDVIAVRVTTPAGSTVTLGMVIATYDAP